MSASSPGTAPNIFPAFKYQDAPAALTWLAQAFGFRKFMEVPGPEGTIAHAESRLGSGVIMLGSRRDDPANPWSAAKQSVYVYVEDIDAHYARAKAAGAQIVMELQNTSYGSREYGVLDPEGFLWGFGNYRPEIER
jgi:uncharacterized glyoxalase superfamily protein PhnB